MAWLFVPASEDSSSESNSPSESDTELWVTSSGTPTPRPLSWRGWKTRPWVQLLSGTTSLPSTLDRGAARWISSLPGSPASPSVSPASSEQQKTNATSFPELLRSFATWDRDSSSWKTSEGCLPLAGVESLGTFSEPWPTSGSIRSGSACEQARWVPPTVESGSLFWRTPAASEVGPRLETLSTADGGPLQAGRRVYRKTPTGKLVNQTVTLGLQAEKIWPTPNAHDGRRPGADTLSTQGANLNRDAATWPTPFGFDHGNGPDGNEFSTAVRKTVATWPTPSTLDHIVKRTTMGRGVRNPTLQGAAAGLNPKDVERHAKTWPTPTAVDAIGGRNRTANRSPDAKKANIGDTLTDMIWQGYPHSPPDPQTETPGLESSQSDPTSPPRWPTPTAPTKRQGGVVNDWGGSGNPYRGTEMGKAKLNPNFVDWMMGWPVGWTTARTGFDAREMASWRSRLRWLLECLLGEQG